MYEYKPGLSKTIGADIPAAIVPLAQGSGAAESLFEGVPRALQQRIREILHVMSGSLKGQAIEVLRNRNVADPVVTETLSAIFDIVADNHWQILERDIQANAAPLTESLQILPKYELAALVENLVSFSALGSRLRPFGSVGGPIDVAVLSNEDGFRWVKRSHYAPDHLNREYR